MITRIGSTIGSSVEGAIPSVAVAVNRPTSAFVMYASSAQGRGGMSSTAIRCWRFAVRSITAPLTGYLNVINSVCKKRKNHRMLLVVIGEAPCECNGGQGEKPTDIGAERIRMVSTSLDRSSAASGGRFAVRHLD